MSFEEQFKAEQDYARAAKHAEAIHVVAVKMLHSAIDSVEHEDYPDLGEDDFMQAVHHARKLLLHDPKVYLAAYNWLATQAEEDV